LIRQFGLLVSWKLTPTSLEQKKAEAALNRSAEQLHAFAARLQQAREEEALRIARELHDQLGRCLTAIKMDVDGIQRELSRSGLVDRSVQPLFARAQRTSQTVSEMVHTVDRISAELRPAILDDLGVAAAIEWQAKDFEARSGVACVVRLPEEDPRLSREQATALFRIFQESLTKVARHARATKVWVYLGEEAGAVVLEVEDNGVGISLAQLAKCRSLGLLGMRERAAALGGKVELTGAPARVPPLWCGSRSWRGVMVRILIVDDHGIVREGLKRIILDEFKDASFGEAASATEALAQVWKNSWDLVLLDISMHGRTGLDVLKGIRASPSRMPVLVLSAHPEENNMRCGCSKPVPLVT
jgi:CheY-like chemotaxis protein/two-component sensor histidine kinase